jgi:hypothetical protein
VLRAITAFALQMLTIKTSASAEYYIQHTLFALP